MFLRKIITGVHSLAGPTLGGAGPNWEQFLSALPSQLAPRSVLVYVLDKPIVDYTLARGLLRRGAQLGAIGPILLRQALLIGIDLSQSAYERRV